MSATKTATGEDTRARPLGLGSPERAAQLLADAIESRREQVVYPRAAAVGMALPGIARRRARRLASRHFTALPAQEREAFLSLAIRSGGDGDEAAREARDAWETRNRRHKGS
ncbi:MAG: hypothetical protein QOI82_3077 [Actinomycetota bacterium]|jgi:hypothetical protein|nr:hypothetical protein [Actinomycetota bacterium]